MARFSRLVEKEILVDRLCDLLMATEANSKVDYSPYSLAELLVSEVYSVLSELESEEDNYTPLTYDPEDEEHGSQD